VTAARTVVVSEDAWLRTALAEALSPAGHDGSEPVAGCRGADVVDPGVELVLLDAQHLGESALDWLERHAAASASPVLVLHDAADVDLLSGCLEAGAAGFQTKDIRLDELTSAIEAVRRGEAVVPRRMLGSLLGHLIERRRRDGEAVAKYERLTRREREILAMIAAGEDRAAIAQRLVISPQTARTHIQNVLTKLEVHSRIDAATFAHEHGYTDLPGEDT
jgi:two-component system nitrate/nitrite response regulator NarL